ncbi:hypothetical protein [Streptomyces rubiginosohelvolus]|uniref:hypothetical protein n=1 Tax=Streptomyces rubiginosohelvolus TaxID=67362 RepID=UPI00365538EC
MPEAPIAPHQHHRGGGIVTSRKRLPDIKKLAAEINKVRTGGKNTIGKSAAYLHSRAADVAKYGSVDGLVEAIDGDADAPAHVFHLSALRGQLARELWARNAFIGPSVLDDLLYQVVAIDAAQDPILRCLEIVRDRQLARPGLVIFPLHSLGVLAAGFLQSHGRRWVFSPPGAEIAIFPQTNAWDTTLANLDEARRSFGVRKAVPSDLLEHWYRSRSLTWLKRNPLLVLSVSTTPGSYYDTESLILGRLRAASALTCMLATLQPREHERVGYLWSSARTNNWETLDIRHYINLYDAPNSRRYLTGDCVPIHLRRAALAEISELNIEIDPRYWNRYGASAQEARAAVDLVYHGYMRHVLLRRPRERPDAYTAAFTKLHDALSYFRRSFHESDQGWTAVLSLATAFEMMLTDGVNRGEIAAKLQRRVRLLLRGKQGVMRYSEAVHSLYKHRNAIIHAGLVDGQFSIADAQRCFVLCFKELAIRTAHLAARESEPMRTMTGDLPDPQTVKIAPCRTCGCTHQH